MYEVFQYKYCNNRYFYPLCSCGGSDPLRFRNPPSTDSLGVFRRLAVPLLPEGKRWGSKTLNEFLPSTNILHSHNCQVFDPHYFWSFARLTRLRLLLGDSKTWEHGPYAEWAESVTSLEKNRYCSHRHEQRNAEPGAGLRTDCGQLPPPLPSPIPMSR